MRLADGAASVDVTSDNQAVADQFFNWGFNDGFGEGAASVTSKMESAKLMLTLLMSKGLLR